MWEWEFIKKAECWRIDAFEVWCWRRLLSPMDCKEIQPVHSKGDQSWVFFARTDAKAETPILWPPHAKSWLIGKDSDAGRDWGQEEKGMTEDEMAGWHHWLDGHKFEWTPGVGDGQGGLVCCDSWAHKESDMTERLNWTEYSTITTNCGKFLKRWEYQITWPASWETCTHVKKQQLEPDMEQCHGLVPNWERSMSRLYTVTLLI